MQHPLEDNLFDFYEYLLLDTLTRIYSAKKKTAQTELIEFSNLIIDKFAIHSSSFFHLSKGIIELKELGEVKMKAYDLFTVNSTFRTIMESYATFNNLFIEPKSEEEQKFRYLLWKIDGLYDKQKFDIYETDFTEAKDILQNDKIKLAATIEEFENCQFYKSVSPKELYKIYKPDKKRFDWRFKIDEDMVITPFKIIDLIKHTCKTRGFINNYKYCSIHTHTNYLAIEHFKQTRGIAISNEYTDPNIKLAIYITCFLICDICSFDENAKNEFRLLPNLLKEYIVGINNSAKKHG